jgi:hypothetical protein
LLAGFDRQQPPLLPFATEIPNEPVVCVFVIIICMD